jgi:hypothetical protein
MVEALGTADIVQPQLDPAGRAVVRLQQGGRGNAGLAVGRGGQSGGVGHRLQQHAVWVFPGITRRARGHLHRLTSQRTDDALRPLAELVASVKFIDERAMA